MSIITTLTNTFLPPLKQGFNELRSENWSYEEVLISYFRNVYFYHQGYKYPSFYEMFKAATLSYTTHSLIKKITQNPASKYRYIPYIQFAFHIVNIHIISNENSKSFRHKLLQISELSTLTLKFLVNPRKAMLDFAWKAFSVAEASNHKVVGIFEFVILWPLFFFAHSSLD